VTTRVAPHDLHAEASLIGAMLLSRDAIAAATETTAAGDFYRPAYGHIFDAIVGLDARGEPADPVTVVDELRRTNMLAAAGGDSLAGDMAGLIAGVPAIGHAARYAGIVADLALQRRLIGVAAEIAELGHTPTDDVAGVVDRAEALVFALASAGRGRADLCTLGATLPDWLERTMARAESGEMTGVPTGWRDLDEKLLGLHPGQLITIGARPAMGKSAMSAWLSAQVAATSGPVLVVNVEMGLGELQDRYVASKATVDLQAVRKAHMSPTDWERIYAAVGRLVDLPLYVEAVHDATLLTIRSLARRVAAKHGGQLALVIVDYLQIVTPVATSRGHENRQVDVAAIADGLKKMALEMQVPVVALAQINRAVEARADKRPMLSDLRESGAVEASSDVVALLYRDEYYDLNSKDKGVLEVIVAKQRNGPTGTVRLAYDARYGRFLDLGPEEWGAA
jgi:replicative DNA helicase